MSGRLALFDSKRTRQEIKTVALTRDAEGFGQSTRPIGAPGYATKRLDGADQYTPRCGACFGGYIQAVVHAVDQVDVGMATGAVQHFGSLGTTVPGVRGWVVLAQVRLNLDDSTSGLAVH